MKRPNSLQTYCKQCGKNTSDSFHLDRDLRVRTNKTPTFCNDCTRLEFNDFKYISRNKNLAGPPNPKTLIPPVVAPPIAELSYWKTNNLITHSHINSQAEQPLYESGFITTSYQRDITVPYEKKGEMYSQHEKFRLPYEKEPGNIKEELRQDKLDQIRTNLETSEPKSIPHFRDVRLMGNGNHRQRLESCSFSNDINTTCGYDEENPFLYDTPTNYPLSECEKSESLKHFNQNLFTQTIQPGVYTRSQVNETPNSNIGISFAQPFEPVSVSKDSNGILFTQHDSNIISNVIEPVSEDSDDPNIYNVYDPRQSSYGTSYRSYNNQLLGQTRFMYDDVDAIRNPNYVTRSHIDHLPFADKYGPMQTTCGIDEDTCLGLREMVNQGFTDSTNQFRTELQERLMRKANNIAWQQRKAPISRNGFCAK